MTSPHRVGQTAAAAREIAHLLEQWGAANPDQRGQQIVDALTALGWTPPGSHLDPPPPPSTSTPAGRERAKRMLADALAARRDAS